MKTTAKAILEVLYSGNVSLPYNGRKFTGTLKVTKETQVGQETENYVVIELKVTVPDHPQWEASASIKREVSDSASYKLVAEATAALFERIQEVYASVTEQAA